LETWASSNVATSVRIRCGRFDQVHRQGGSGAFAQPQAQVQKRLLFQSGVHGSMAPVPRCGAPQ